MVLVYKTSLIRPTQFQKDRHPTTVHTTVSLSNKRVGRGGRRGKKFKGFFVTNKEKVEKRSVLRLANEGLTIIRYTFTESI